MLERTRFLNNILIVTLDLFLIVPHYSHQVERPLKSKPHDGEKVRDEGEMMSGGACSAEVAVILLRKNRAGVKVG